MFVIDAKVSLAFGDEADGDEEAQAKAASLRTATSMKTHVRQLSSKAYQDQFKPSPPTSSPCSCPATPSSRPPSTTNPI